MIRVESLGTGPPLILLHGWAMHGGIFAPLVSALAPHRTLKVIDLPGHGNSPWREESEFTLSSCTAAIEEARLPRAPWLGWSLGGLVALRAAVDHVDTITGLIGLATTPRFTRTHDWPDAVDDAVLAGFAAGLVSDTRGTLRRFLALEAHGSDHLRNELRFLQQQLDARPAPQPRVLTDGLAILRESDFRAELEDLAPPSLWIGGARDRLVPWRSVEAAAARCGDGTSMRIAYAGHAPFLSHADEVANGVLAWLAERSL